MPPDLKSAAPLWERITCVMGCDPAISPVYGIYWMPKGCVCKPDQVQALCIQHAYKSEPLESAELIMLSPLLKPRARNIGRGRMSKSTEHLARQAIALSDIWAEKYAALQQQLRAAALDGENMP